MPFEAKTLPERIACTTYLQAYPYPAFVLSKRHAGKLGSSLVPIYSNRSWKNLLFGPLADQPVAEKGGLLQSLDDPNGLQSIEDATKLGEWVEAPIPSGPEAATQQPTHLLTLRPRWFAVDQPPVQLELIRTSVDHFWVITSIPRTQLPWYTTPPPSPGKKEASPTTGIKRDASAKLKLADFASLNPTLPQYTIEPGPSDSPVTVRLDTALAPVVPLLERPVEFLGSTAIHDGEMQRMMANFPWHTSPLGPLSQWPQSLKSAASLIMASPYQMALWWGPELTVIYNDGYREMAESKHPFVFGKAGSVAWGEIWDSLGPLANKVLSGEVPHVAKTDDLLFFNRLGPKKLPEEVYHTWQWVPVMGEGGKIGGLVNSNMETSAKVIAARRLLLLRDLGDKTVLAQNKKEYADAVLKVLEKHPIDVPFAALYFSSVEANAKPPTSIGPSADGPKPAPSNIRVSLQLAGTIGLPPNHAETPETLDVVLHPVTQHPMRKATALLRRARNAAANFGGISPLSDESLSTLDDSPSVRSDASTVMGGGSSSDSVAGAPQWPLYDAFGSRTIVHVDELPESVANTVIRRGWGDKPREAVVIQLAGEGDGSRPQDVPLAILVLGLNTRRPYDKDYQTWMEILRMSLSTSLTAGIAREAEKLKTEQLAQLDAAKTTFFSSASHELRTPLTLISGPLEDVLATTQDAKAKELLKLASRNVSRLSRLVDSLMQFSRLEAGRLQGQFRAIQLDAFTVDLCSLFRSTIEKSNIEFNIEISPQATQVVYVDPDFWEKIVFNLIGNAFKYTLQGSITVRMEYDEKYCKFIVKDTGVGIPEEDMDKIFGRFHRVASISRSHEGTGIGLSLTRELVRLHQGEIYVESVLAHPVTPELPHGSTFTVSIPLGKSHLAPDLTDDSDPEFSYQRSYARGIVEEAAQWTTRSNLASEDTNTPSESSDSGGSSEGNKSDLSLFNFSKKDVILIVDDSSDVKAYIRSIFNRLCTVVEASNGKEALDMVLAGPRPDLIISDVMMPVMDGYSLLAALREHHDTQLIPVILLTARAGEEARMEGLLSGADDYVGKPFRSRELIARAHLQMQVGRRKMEMQLLFDQRTQEIQVLSDLSPVGIIRLDIEGKVTYTNNRWHQITGHSSHAPLSEWMRDIHEDDVGETMTLWNSCFERRRGGSLDMRWRNGTWTKIQVEPLTNGLIATITDISDRRLYEAAQLAQAQEREQVARQRAVDAEERQRESDSRRRAQELLVDVTSHELRQPVSAILNCSALVRSNLGELHQDLQKCYVAKVPFSPTEVLLTVIDDDLEALDAIYQCGLAQERIANDVLSLSRIQLQVLSIHPVDFDLVPEVKRILSIFTNELKMKAISMGLEFGTSIEAYGVKRVSADKARFAQVVTNLLSNAIKFTDTSPPSRRNIRVFVEVSDRPPLQNQCIPPPEDTDGRKLAKIEAGSTLHIFVAVKDSGPGLKPDDLNLLFQRFQQGSNSHDVFGGSGLGLFVSRKLCDLMGGNIDVDSVYGEGATFRFYISAVAVEQIPETGEQTSQHLTSSRKPRPSSGSTAVIPAGVSQTAPPTRMSYHVLITEDNLINQTVLNRQLKQAGFTTSLANNGEQAINQIKKLALGDNAPINSPRRFDVILMDCEMPVMDGLTAVREIRRMETSGELPFKNRIIAVTGNARSAQVESAWEAGMDDVLIKPYKLEGLLSKIRQIVAEDDK